MGAKSFPHIPSPPTTHHPSPNYELPRNRRISIQQHPRLRTRRASAYKEGLETTKALDEHFGHPHTHFLSIHVAGTNGKAHAPTRWQLSSKLKDIRSDSIPVLTSLTSANASRVNGEMISEQEVIDFVEQERNFFEPLHPSFFELTTALAFKHFAEQKVDIAIIEVGLGGRLDCTKHNHSLSYRLSPIYHSITPSSSVIRSERLQQRRLVLSKHRVPVVIGESVPETQIVFKAKAQKEDALIVFAEDIPAILSSHPHPDGGIAYQTRFFGNIVGELGGSYQREER